MTYFTTKGQTKTEALLQKYFTDTIEKQSCNCHREWKDNDQISSHFKKEHFMHTFSFLDFKPTLPPLFLPLGW